jgi:hypothetical protein
MSVIRSLHDLTSYFPEVEEGQGDRLFRSPCPFCSPDVTDGDVWTVNDITFVGDDRLVWRNDHVWCSRCYNEGRKHRHTYPELLQYLESAGLSFDVEPSFYDIQPSVISDRPIQFWSEWDVIQAHMQVQRDYWYQFGWSDETINHFKLGLSSYRGQLANVIPTYVRTATETGDWWYPTFRHETWKGSVSLSGSRRDYFWLIQDNPDDDLILLTEGEKDSVTLWDAGYRNIASSFGASSWSYHKTQALYDAGFKRIWVLGDNDEPGETFNTNVSGWAKDIGFEEVKAIQWGDLPSKYDLTDIYVALGTGIISFLEDSVKTLDVAPLSPAPLKSEFIPDYTAIKSDHVPETVDPIPLQEIRGEGTRSLRHRIVRFLDEYDSKTVRGRGVMLLLRPGPGAGKTHTLVRVAERMAREAYADKLVERTDLEQQIENLGEEISTGEWVDTDERDLMIDQKRKMKDRLDNFSFTSIMWVSPFRVAYEDVMEAGANPNLWFNFKARDIENCQNFPMAQRLGANNHNVGKFCEIACPFKGACVKAGYLSQNETRKEKPITVFRHQSLVKGSLANDYKNLVVVDESPFHVLEDPMVCEAREMYPHRDGWELDVEQVTLDAIEQLITSLRLVMNTNVGQNDMISGAGFLKILDSQMQEKLAETIDLISSNDLHTYYQPEYLGDDPDQVLPRCVPFVYDAIKLEIASYVADPENKLPSRIHLVSGKLEVYPMAKVRISSNTPVIAANATGMMEELYEAMFGRTVEVFQPVINNPNATTTVFHGSDWTLSTIEQQIGKELRERQRRIEYPILDIKGQELDLSTLPVKDKLYDAPIIKDARDVVKVLAERHPELLVVTHKRIVGVLKELFEEAYPDAAARLHWGHYGSLRGTNKFKDVPAAVMIGLPRMPYNVMWRRIQAWGSLLELDEPIPYEMSYLPSPYHTKNAGHTHYTFTHPFARKFADDYEIGEMIQCQERIRPHATNEEKHVYVFASRPAGNFVDEIKTKRAALDFYRGESKASRVKDFMIATWNETNDVPRRKDILSKFSCGTSMYTKAKKEAERELGVTFPTKRR